MYKRSDGININKKLSSREKNRLKVLWKRVIWLEEKAKKADADKNRDGGFYRQEMSAFMWAHDYILAHKKEICENNK